MDLADRLIRVKALAPSLDAEADWRASGPSLKILRDRGTYLAYQMFGNPKAFYEFADACAFVLTPELRRLANPPLVELNGLVENFPPIELLPFFDKDWPDQIETATDVQLAAQSFLGFSAVIRRVPHAEVSQDTLLRSRPMPIAFVRNERLTGARNEAEALQGFGQDTVTVDDPIRRSAGLEAREVATLLSRRIYRPVSDANIGAPPDQVLHFACHCDSDASAPANWLLRVGDEIRVTMDDLIVELSYRERERSQASPASPRPSRPLVFMNACDTSTMNPVQVASFVHLFLANGNRGFIGTETRIPDRVAAFFSHVFYERVLAGDTVGQAIHKAKWDLLLKYKNPLGVLYTLYGNPDLSIHPT
jgi:hypothetical protein